MKERILVKVGTALTTMKDGRLNLSFLAHLTEELSSIMEQRYEVVLVSSGAVASGRRVLEKSSHSLQNRQALAAIGQPVLMEYYRDFFRIHDKYVAQCLFTTRDFDNRDARRIMTEVLEANLTAGIIPIINENDTASDIEMRYGDNDQLASRLAILLKVDKMFLLSDVQGLYTKDPQKYGDAKLISEIPEITPDIIKMAGDKVSAHSMGGMKSKIQAFRRAVLAGIPSYLLHGRTPKILSSVLIEGKKEGTFFHASTKKLNEKERIRLMSK